MIFSENLLPPIGSKPEGMLFRIMLKPAKFATKTNRPAYAGRSISNLDQHRHCGFRDKPESAAIDSRSLRPKPCGVPSDIRAPTERRPEADKLREEADRKPRAAA